MPTIRIYKSSRVTGFTLLELLVAITIVAIVSAIALPLYTQFTDRSYRVEAQSDLMNCVQGLERWSAMNFSYLGAADEDNDGAADGPGSGSDAGALGQEICRPNSVDQNRYDITIAADATTYTLTAEAVDGGPMDGEGDITIDSAGNRTWDENADGALADPGDLDWEED